jgi:hypothetical protein
MFAGVVLILLCSTPLFAAKKPITHETMWAMKRVGAPVPSPNGKWVVMPVVEPSYDPRSRSPTLWIAFHERRRRPAAANEHQERREQRGMVG